ncbi:MAG TPA: hypothetical protein VK925_00690 [Jiangellaceae bacterium]|nr:hypothetical protein [Jiangellaceae bacterium]
MVNHDDEVDPKGPLGIPVATGLSDGISHHSPGFDESLVEAPEYAADASATPLTSEVPPSAPDEVPRASLSEQLTGQMPPESAR